MLGKFGPGWYGRTSGSLHVNEMHASLATHAYLVSLSTERVA